MITPDGTAKLTDFGIAKGLEVTQLTATNCTVGTAAYMSPEQCRGERDLTSKSDLYSLGVLFYELLTGKGPFQAETTLDMFLAHTEGKFERPSRIVLDIPIWLDTLVCQMLEKRPDRRPYDAAMVSDSLNRVIEKVTAQRSAGVDAVTETGSHRPRSVTRTDETDLEAARALKASKTKKRIKPEGTPLFQRGWVQLVAICGVLGAVGWITYEALRPPSAQSLYEKAKRLMESSDADEWAKAREGPIRDYLRYYPVGADEHSAQVQAWADKVDLEDREKQLRNRMRMRMSPDGEAEQIAQNAVRAEEAGELEAALERWRSLGQKYKGSSDLDAHAWGLLGEKRLKDLQAVQEKELQLRRRIDQARYAGEEFKPSSEAERLAAQATHYEMFEDQALALRQWQKLKEIFQADLQSRPLVVLATKRISQLKGSAPAGTEERKTRQALVSKNLAKAVELAPDDWKEARAICLDIVELYGKAEEPELIGMVGDAKKLLSDHQANPNEKPTKPPPGR
jgi:serine/threonine-protein kinase